MNKGALQVIATVAVCLTMAPLASPAKADALRCQRTISSASARFAKAKARILKGCKHRAAHSGVPALTTDCPLTSQDDRIHAAADRMRSKIARDCGGANRVCNAADVNENADVPLAEIGWNILACPDLSGQGCVNPIANCDDVATCLICIGHEAVNQPIDLAYDLMMPAEFGTHSAVNDCQVAIGQETARSFSKSLSQISACWDAVLRGKSGFTAPCPATDSPTVERLALFEARRIDHICKECGAGGDLNADGLCDAPGQAITPAAIGFEPDCPDKTIPGGVSCARVVTTLDDLIACTGCLTAFELACSTDLAVPTAAPYPAECSLVP